MLPTITDSVRTPGSMACIFWKLRTRRPSPVTITRAMATWATTIPRRRIPVRAATARPSRASAWAGSSVPQARSVTAPTPTAVSSVARRAKRITPPSSVT